ncbi:MAG: hypothetical protein FDX18_05905 [Chlorobium sp.]|nr:MAG: hypothetical protein FDX18_05905 [Chlorobium sp.]
MSNESSMVIILCEDSQQEAFLRRFLKKRNIVGKKIRVVKNPAGKGSGEHFVRKEFPMQLNALRKRSAKTDLIVAIDADLSEVTQIRQKLETACSEQQIDRRAEKERVSFIIPKRNIETWIHYLNGNEVNEQSVYPKLQKESDCQSAVDYLYEICSVSKSSAGFPDSLLDACHEYKKIER